METISQRELRNNSGEILRRVDDGDTFLITRNGTPVAELAPMRRHRFVRTDAVLAIFRGAPPVDLARLRRDLDGVATQAHEPRG